MQVSSLFLLAFTFFSTQSRAQSSNTEPNILFSCKFLLTYKPDSTSSSTKQDAFFLLSDGKSSVFKEQVALKQDSLVKAYEGLPMNETNVGALTTQLMKMPAPTFSFSVYKKYASREVAYFDKINKVNYYYEETRDFIKWNITPEKKNIKGYNCQKATTIFGGRVWNAWFTREVALTDGPYKFYGLPGLIIEANDIKNQYIFSLEKIQQVKPFLSVLAPTQKVSKTTKKELVQAKRAYLVAMPNIMATKGIAVPESRVQAYNERLKKQNNLIELK